MKRALEVEKSDILSIGHTQLLKKAMNMMMHLNA